MSTPTEDDASLVERARRRMANMSDSTVEPESNDAWFKPTVIALIGIIVVSLLTALFFFLTGA